VSNAKPLTGFQRRDNYVRQNNQPMMTPRQRRRWQHKRNHAAAPFGKRAAR